MSMTFFFFFLLVRNGRRGGYCLNVNQRKKEKQKKGQFFFFVRGEKYVSRDRQPISSVFAALFLVVPSHSLGPVSPSPLIQHATGAVQQKLGGGSGGVGEVEGMAGRKAGRRSFVGPYGGSPYLHTTFHHAAAGLGLSKGSWHASPPSGRGPAAF